MGSTTQGLRYPEPTDRLNGVAQYIEDLAEDVTRELGERDALLVNRARIRAVSAGVQTNVNGRAYVACGFSWDDAACVISAHQMISGTMERNGITVTGWSGPSGVVYLSGIGAGATCYVAVVSP